MNKDSITVSSVIDKRLFYRFAIFDGFIKQRRFILPAQFSGIFLLFAGACFYMRDSASQAVLLGGVLLGVGVGLPLFYFLYFINSVRLQAKALGLKAPREIYSLTLTDTPFGIEVKNGAGELARYEWKSLHGVYRDKGCTYLYVLSSRAFLLPDTGVSEGYPALWELFSRVLPEDKIKNKRVNN